jgi:hypothetical protein
MYQLLCKYTIQGAQLLAVSSLNMLQQSKYSSNPSNQAIKLLQKLLSQSTTCRPHTWATPKHNQNGIRMPLSSMPQRAKHKQHKPCRLCACSVHDDVLQQRNQLQHAVTRATYEVLVINGASANSMQTCSEEL